MPRAKHRKCVADVARPEAFRHRVVGIGNRCAPALQSRVRSTLIVGLVAATGVIVWLFAARSLSVLIDRVHTIRIAAVPVNQLRFDNGTIEVAGVRLDTLTRETMPSGLRAALGTNGRVSLVYGGMSFPCGPGRSLSPSWLPDLVFSPDPGDSVTFTRERSHLSWPTPLEMNFMTGSAPSWKRHQYCRLTWTKRSRARLEILWQIEQGYFNNDGWRPQKIEYVSAGLLRAGITEASDLQDAAVDYLTRTRHWDRSAYRLESRGPAADSSGEIIAAIHRDDESKAHPGSGLSLQLLLDYDSRRVTREIAFQ
jgi:hypothetical protein